MTASTPRGRATASPEITVERETATTRHTPTTGAAESFRDQLDDEVATREIDPIQFRALLEQTTRARSLRAATVPATEAQLQDLVAQTVRDDDDLAIPVAKRPAVLVPEPIAAPVVVQQPTASTARALVYFLAGTVAFSALTTVVLVMIT